MVVKEDLIKQSVQNSLEKESLQNQEVKDIKLLQENSLSRERRLWPFIVAIIKCCKMGKLSVHFNQVTQTEQLQAEIAV